MDAYPKSHFKNKDVIEKANMFGLTSIENEDLTLAGLIAKMKEWQEQEGGVPSYVYNMTKKDIKAAGGKIPSDIECIII